MGLKSVENRGGFRLDLAGALLVVVVGITLLPLQLVASQVYIRTLPFVLAIGGGLYLLAARTGRVRDLPRLPRSWAHALPSVTMLGVAVMIVSASLSGRTLLFYYVAGWMMFCVLLQIFFVADRELHAGVLLAQIVLVGLVFRLAAIYTTPGYVGIDVWTHVPKWADAILAANSLEPISAEKYYAAPLFHLLVVVGSQLLEVSIRESLFLTVGLAMPFTVAFVYATTELFVDARWALFATAVFTFSADVVEWGIHLIPTSLGLVFFLGVVYSLTRILYLEYSARDYVLVVLFSLAVILTHQISTFIMLVFVGAGLVSRVLFSSGLLTPRSPRGAIAGNRDTINLAGLLTFDLGFITFIWSLTPYRGANFLETMLSWFLTALTSSAAFLNLAGGSAGGGDDGGAATRSLIEQITAYLDAGGLLLALFLAVLGGLYVLRRENTSHAAVTISTASIVMLVFVFGFPLFGIRMFVPGRWIAFLTALLAIVGAIGLGYLSSDAPVRVAVAVLLLFSLAYPLVVVPSGEATQDAPVFDGTQLRYGYTERELAAVDTVDEITAPEEGERLYTDHPYYTVFDRAREHPTGVGHLDNGTVTNRTFLYREYQFSGAAYFEDRRGRPFQTAIRGETACAGRDVTYDNGDVRLCVTGPRGA